MLGIVFTHINLQFFKIFLFCIKQRLIEMIAGRHVRHLFKRNGLGCDKNSSNYNYTTENNAFRFNKVLLLYKLSRLEIETCRRPELSINQLKKDIEKRGADYESMKKHHEINKEFQKKVQACFESFGVETKIVNRLNYSQENINWCDVVFPIGGDGTFLFAASRVVDNKKPVIGLNSDPCRSEGHLCLPRKYSTDIQSAIQKIFQGNFKWMFRARIRVTFSGGMSRQNPIELHEPVQRYKLTDEAQKNVAKGEEEYQGPFLALNEVFLGEVLTAKVSYFEMRLNNSKKSAKVKSSGLCVSTGTGSTSWSMSINRLGREDIREILKLYSREAGRPEDEIINDKLITSVCDNYNQRFRFNPENKKMAYTIRDIISVGVWPYPKGVIEPRGFADKIEVISKCTDAALVLDGGITFPFNDGTVAHLEIHSEDALKTVVLL